MKQFIVFALTLLTLFFLWLLWRVDSIIGRDTLMLIFGGVLALAAIVPIAVVYFVVATVRRENEQARVPAQAQQPQFQQPVYVMLADGRHSEGSPYAAPADWIANAPASRLIAERRQEWDSTTSTGSR